MAPDALDNWRCVSCVFLFRVGFRADDLAPPLAPLRLLLRTPLENALDCRFPVPPRGFVAALALRFRAPPERVELVANVLNIVALEPAHCAVAALDAAVRQSLHLVRKDVAGDRRKPVVVVRQA